MQCGDWGGGEGVKDGITALERGRKGMSLSECLGSLNLLLHHFHV